MIISSRRTHGHYYLRVEPNPYTVRDALYLLATKCHPILSFVDSNANLSDTGNPLGLAGKAQCDNVRTFIVNGGKWANAGNQAGPFGAFYENTQTVSRREVTSAEFIRIQFYAGSPKAATNPENAEAPAKRPSRDPYVNK
jgi:hypothetical protein